MHFTLITSSAVSLVESVSEHSTSISLISAGVDSGCVLAMKTSKGATASSLLPDGTFAFP